VWKLADCRIGSLHAGLLRFKVLDLRFQSLDCIGIARHDRPIRVRHDGFQDALSPKLPAGQNVFEPAMLGCVGVLGTPNGEIASARNHRGNATGLRRKVGKRASLVGIPVIREKLGELVGVTVLLRMRGELGEVGGEGLSVAAHLGFPPAFRGMAGAGMGADRQLKRNVRAEIRGCRGGCPRRRLVLESHLTR